MGQTFRLDLQLVDDAVDLAPRLPDFSFELIRQPFPVGFLTLLERFFALAHARFCGRERLAFTCHESLFVFNRTQVLIDLCQVLGELGVASAAFGFLPDTFAPTYQLVYGTPGRNSCSRSPDGWGSTPTSLPPPAGT